ncbi:hypothetical protein OQW59_20180 [Citrobacter freundii]|uniref:hypothetical protein n=1 Tax=Citrobacter freundii TaxID=546 RepID=UPI0022497410|nr:hypothetical protein [Citrobacter freundii]UZQ88494.1 hypothetical protein OQW59_20180 [Citrobacter freundii]UZQ94831.1 hypothetical protein OQY67_24635 [Citrobacter freundii]UZQ99336.1 hypothetical protein OQZ20_20305 [Citrobacter freundii]
MNATEKDNVFYCDCGFSWRRGMSGSHNCEDGLRAKLTDMAVQLANAESKCRALAVDNASLKNPENWLLQSDYGYEASEVATQNGATEDESLRAGMIAIINRIVTPATDAFLAEVRAQGLERLAKAWYAIANETASGISISESSRLKYRQRADDVADFANEIRKEAAQ